MNTSVHYSEMYTIVYISLYYSILLPLVKTPVSTDDIWIIIIMSQRILRRKRSFAVTNGDLLRAI